MAIAALKKIEILGHNAQRDDVLEFLQRAGQVEVIDLADRKEEYQDFSFDQLSIPYEKVTNAVEKLSWTRSFLEALAETKRPAFASKPVVRRQRLADLLRDFDYEAFYSRCREVEASFRDIEKKRLELESRKKELLPWAGLDTSLDRLTPTEFTACTLGAVRIKNLPALKEHLRSLPDIHLERVDEDSVNIYLFVTYMRSDEEQIHELLRQNEFAFHHLPHYSGPIEEVIERFIEDEQRLEAERLAQLQAARTMLSEETKVAGLLDYFSNLERKEGAKQCLLYSQETFFFQGWIRHGDAEAARKKLEKKFETVGVYLADPSSDDVLPIVLENKKAVQPFEFLTGIYGYPGYKDIDPTPFMAPFFFIFFGYCLGDAVYGLILASFALFALKKFRLGDQGTRLFRLVFYCGVSTIVMGILTSGWLGDLSKYLFHGVIPALWVNPQDKPTAVLNIALMLGILQIWTGYAVAAYDNLRRKDYAGALLEQLPVFLLLAGLTGLGLIFLKTIPAGTTTVFMILTVLGAVGIIAGHGRHEPSIGGRIGFGILGLYTTASGYLSDILSYSRLWALGLVTAAMASTVNLIAATLGELVPVVGIVFTIIILVVGHLITLLVNTLGAFVHPIRLQFVEFFSKFFKSTGKPFQPLSIQNRFTIVEE
jgi:V/A-type H+-transporting ATPase subunit I